MEKEPQSSSARRSFSPAPYGKLTLLVLILCIGFFLVQYSKKD